MKVEYRKKFLKELSKIPSNIRQKIEHFVFDEFPKMSSVSESGMVEQMKGYPSFY
ncbi:plasmid stabilization system [Candidatus Poribacteria bacterium]|nr:plasmid stabilization system [Candidatus Poribacteria bacterium]